MLHENYSLLIIRLHIGLLHTRPHPLLVLSRVVPQQLGRHVVGRGAGVGVAQQGLDAGQDGGHVVGGAPPLLEDVQADGAVLVDVGVEHLGGELDHGRLVGILFTELQGETEDSVLKRGVY